MAIKTTSTRKVTNSSTLSSAYSATATITQVVITDSNYDALDDTTVSSAGGYIKILGLGFMSGYSLYYNGVAIATSTLVSSNEIRAVIPSIANGTYNLTLFNSNNTGALYVLTASGFPTWTTGTYTNQTGVVSVQLLVTGDAPLTYSLQAGSSLPNGVTLSSSGLLSGTLVGVSSNATYTFVVLVNDVQNQTTQETITLNVVFADPQFNYTTLLLNGETTVTPFINDASTNNFALTINGDTKPVLFNPYQAGYYSNYFDGNGDYLVMPSSTSFALSTGDFTIECWIYPTAWTNDSGSIIDFRISGGSGSQIKPGLSLVTGTLRYFVSATTRISTTLASLNTWYHVALVRLSGSTKLYVNGTQVGSTYTDANDYGSSAQDCIIGQVGDSRGFATGYYTGYISNLRLVKGTALYTSAFTPSTTPLTAIANTSLLTCQSNRFIDNSTNNFTITKAGDVSVSPNIPFASNSSYSTYGSTYFDGTGDVLTLASGQFPVLGTNNFTMEAWVYTTSVTSTGGIFDMWNGGTSAFLLRRSSTSLQIYVQGSQTIDSGAILNVNTWFHVAVVRNGTTITLYVNGLSVGTPITSYSTSITGNVALGIGGTATTGNEGWIGYITDARIVNGTAVYTANFTPPTSPLTAIANTSLLTCQYNGGATNQGFIDNSNFNNIITRVGNTSQGTFSPYSVTGWSNYFNGSSDFMNSSGGAGVGGTSFGYGTGNFTWECWIYPLSSTWTSGNFYICDHGSNGGVMQYNANVFRYYNGGTAYDSAAGLIPNGVWTHIAVSRISGFTTTYINGIVAKASTADSKDYGTSNQFWLARYGAGGNIFPGYISNFRIVKGVGVYTGAFTPSTTPLTATQGAGTNINAITNQTTLLICQSNRFVNNSPVAISYDGGTTFNVGGTPSVQAFGPFGSIREATPISYSVYFDGTGDYLTTTTSANLALQSNDFTVELWYYPTGRVQSYPVLISNGNFGSQKWQINDRHSSSPTKVSVNLHAGSSGDGWLVSTTTISVNTWYHVALVRSGSTFTLYINGVGEQSKTLSGSITAATDFITLGQDQNQGVTCYTGYISNARIVNGTAVYTSNFTPSTTPLTAIANTSLLTCQSTTMIDNSTNNFTITAAGNTVPRIFNPFGYTAQSATSYTPTTHGGSAYFDGTGDYIQATVVPPGTGNFTLESWVYINSSTIPGSSSCNVVSIVGSGSSTGFQIFYATGGWGVRSNSANIISTSVVPSVYTWHHVAIVRNSGTTTLYVNGVSIGSTASAYTFSDTQFNSGYSPIGQTMTGYVSDIRYTNGIALYKANFIPTQTLTNYSTSYPASLLLNFNKGGIIDQHGSNVLETVGNAQLSTQVKKYNNASMYFDGTGDYLSIPTNQLMNFGTGDFTVEAWVYPNSLSTDWFIITASGSGGFFVGFSSTSTIGFGWGRTGTAWDYRVAGNATVSTWQHVAVTRSGTSMRLFVNGTQSGTTQTLTTAYDMSTTSTTVGSQGANFYLNGYIDDLRITKGFARYTANFTAPTSALVGQ